MYTSGSGNLIIKPLSAVLTHDTESFGKMDPYMIVKVGNQAQKTSICKNAGKFPAWSDTMTFRKGNEDLINVEIWDDDDASKDDLIGQGSIAFSTIVNGKNLFNDWIQLTYKGRSAGKCLLNISFFPDGMQQQGFQQVGFQPQVQVQVQPGYQQPTVYQQPYQQQQVGFQQQGYQPQPGYQQPGYQPQVYQQGYQQPGFQGGVQVHHQQQGGYPGQQVGFQGQQQVGFQGQQGGYPGQQGGYPGQQGGYPGQQGYGGYPGKY